MCPNPVILNSYSWITRKGCDIRLLLIIIYFLFIDKIFTIIMVIILFFQKTRVFPNSLWYKP